MKRYNRISSNQNTIQKQNLTDATETTDSTKYKKANEEVGGGREHGHYESSTDRTFEHVPCLDTLLLQYSSSSSSFIIIVVIHNNIQTCNSNTTTVTTTIPLSNMHKTVETKKMKTIHGYAPTPQYQCQLEGVVYPFAVLQYTKTNKQKKNTHAVTSLYTQVR